jgi:leucine-zipper-like transcriptional regulator 1
MGKKTQSAQVFLALISIIVCGAARSETQWTEATNDAPWAARSGHTCTLFNNKVWILGGGHDGLMSDVWWSEDGAQWTVATHDAMWGKRSQHTSEAFDGKLWVIGGFVQDDGWRNDVWCSQDGLNWSQATDHAPWSSRGSHTTLVFDNRIWVLGGYTSGSDKVDSPRTTVPTVDPVSDGSGYVNDVWWSKDGVNWTEATHNAPWPARVDHASVVFDNKIWVIGGMSDNPVIKDEVFLNDVWWSADGTNWTEATDNAPWIARCRHTSAVFEGKIWICGGLNDNVDCTNDTWWSADGEHWTENVDEAPWTGRQSHASVVFNNEMWVMGGESGGNAFNDVWLLNGKDEGQGGCYAGPLKPKGKNVSGWTTAAVFLMVVCILYRRHWGMCMKSGKCAVKE